MKVDINGVTVDLTRSEYGIAHQLSTRSHTGGFTTSKQLAFDLGTTALSVRVMAHRIRAKTKAAGSPDPMASKHQGYLWVAAKMKDIDDAE